MVNDLNELAVPATGSGLGAATGYAILNYTKSQVEIINQLMGNVLIFSLFSIGAFFLALSLGQYFHQSKANRKYASGVSFAASNLSEAAFPVIVGNVLLNNAQAQNLEATTNNYITLMFLGGIIFLGVGIYILHEYVR